MSPRTSRRFKTISGLFRPRTPPLSTSSSTAHPTAQRSTSGSKAFVVSNAALVLDIVEKLSGFAQTIPFIAPAAGFLSQIVKAYQSGVDDETRDNALSVAAGSGDLEMVRLIFDGQVNLKAALYSACKNGCSEVAQFLLSKGGQTTVAMLETASEEGHLDVVRIILANLPPQAKTKWEYFKSALSAAVESGKIEVINLLLANGGAFPADEDSLAELLDDACHNDNAEVVQLLLEKGADVNGKVSSPYRTPLQAAAYSGTIDVCRLLIQRGADVNFKVNDSFSSALQEAASWGHADIIRLLIENGADLNARSGKYGTALQAAVCSSTRSMEVMDLLLNNGADVNARGGVYETPLQAAAAVGLMDVVGLLLSRGADIGVQGGKYGSALGAASAGKHVEVVRMLREHGAEAESPGNKKLTTSLKGLQALFRSAGSR